MTLYLGYKFLDTGRMNKFVEEAKSLPKISRMQTHPTAQLQVWINDSDVMDTLRRLTQLASKYQGSERNFYE